MKPRDVNDWFLYRWRYRFGYALLATLFVLAIIGAGLYAPGGLTQAEVDMVGISNTLDFTNPASLAVTNLPFHLLQLVLFKLFGVSILTIKLPAIILSALSMVVIFFLLRRWFKPNVTILSMLIMATTSQFIFVAQSFTPHILYVFYTALILLFASLIFQRARLSQLWKNGLAITTGLSLFTPYFWYINIGLLVGALLHPHTRHFLIGKKYHSSWFPALTILSLALLPVIVAGLLSPHFIKDVLALDVLNFDIANNAKVLAHTYARLEPSVIGGQIVPIMDFSALALIILGLLRAFRQRHTARAYMIGAWFLLVLPLLLLRPHLNIIITIALFILLAVGMETLLKEWYDLFPKNPYARSVGLILIIGLIGVMTLSGIDRHIHGYRYMPGATYEFSDDLALIQPTIKQQPLTLVLTAAERPVYEAYAQRSAGQLTIYDTLPETIPNRIAVSRSAMQHVTPEENWQLARIIVNDHSLEGDRFYIYKTSE